jgi:NTP pyrophosphatase (non-canonical NTP hydrolase)
MEIKELCKEAHRISCSKGFWGNFCQCDYPENTPKEYDKCPRCGNNWEKDKRNISELLMLCVSELGEACEALRKNRRQKDYVELPSVGDRLNKKVWEKDTFEDEICDTFIRLADLCQALNIDIEWQIKNKLSYNEKREYKHGKAF